MTYYEIENELEAFLKSFPKDRQPTCLSYWNSGSDYKEKIAATVKLCGKSDLFDYQYFFPDSIKKDIAHKLGFSDDAYEKSFFAPLSQSTLSIVTVAIFLKKYDQKVGIIEPIYYSAQDCFDDFAVPYRLFSDYMENINSTFDADALLQSDCTAFWFTSPINGCSIYFKDHVIKGIQKLLDAGKMVVLDESLCVNGMELSRALGVQENLIYIYSPHKTLGIQGIKFSYVVVHTKYYEDINNLEDTYGGSLNYSCQEGAEHFISKNFDDCLQRYTNFWQENFLKVKGILKNYDFAHVLPETFGHYAMIFIDRPVTDACFIEATKFLMKEKGYYVYPGAMQGFDSKKGFCFRVNMLLNATDIEKGLRAVLDYIKNAGNK